MPSLESILQVDLKHALERLLAAQDRLADMLIAQVNYPLAIQGQEESAQMRPTVANFIKLLEYANDQMKPGDTVNLVGVVGTTQQTLDQITQVNTARKQLQDLLKQLDKHREPDDGKMVSVTKRALAKLGYPRFNRRQARRQLVTFAHNLDTVSFTWARSKIVSEISVKEARTLLDNKYKDDNAAAAQEAWHAQKMLLDVLPPDEPLVRVAKPVVHPRANIKYTQQNETIRTVKMAISPLFMLCNENGSLPRIKPLSDVDATSERLKRSDTQVEEEAYIRSIRIHRYKSEFIDLKKRKRKNKVH